MKTESIISKFKESAAEYTVTLPCTMKEALKFRGFGPKAIDVLVAAGLVYGLPKGCPQGPAASVISHGKYRDKADVRRALAKGEISVSKRNCGGVAYEKIVQWVLSED